MNVTEKIDNYLSEAKTEDTVIEDFYDFDIQHGDKIIFTKKETGEVTGFIIGDLDKRKKTVKAVIAHGPFRGYTVEVNEKEFIDYEQVPQSRWKGNKKIKRKFEIKVPKNMEWTAEGNFHIINVDVGGREYKFEPYDDATYQWLKSNSKLGVL